MSPCIDACLFIALASLGFSAAREIMPRTKLVLKLIENEKKRKATYKNRRDGLVQKVSQFSTLCGVDAFLVCFGPAAAGGEVTTWPPDRGEVLKRIASLRALPPGKIKQVQNTCTRLREDLTAQQRALLKVQQQQSGADEVLTLWDYRFDDLSLDGLNALHDTLCETLERVHRRMAALRGVHDDGASSSTFALAAPAPHAVALPDNDAFDFPFALSNPSAVAGALCYYPLPDTLLLPQPVPCQTPCFAYQMPPPCLAYQMPPPALAAAPLEFDQSIMSGTTFMDSNPYATTNIVHGGSTATTAVLDDHGQFLAAGAGYEDDLLAHDFAFAAGSGYDLEPRVSTAEVWPMNTLNDPVDGIAFQQQNNSRELLPGRSSGSNFQDVSDLAI
uniref:MADS-box domain-containing protein n=1 Tax=Oryza brachyantha TaxID=4533 RepID=J3L6X2_ORYBR